MPAVWLSQEAVGTSLGGQYERPLSKSHCPWYNRPEV